MSFTRRETAFLLGGDLLLLAFSLWSALAIRNLALPSPSYFFTNLGPFIPVFLLSLVIFYIAGLYEKQTKLVKSIMGTRVLGAQIANVIIAAVLFFLLPLSIAPKTILALYLFISVALISVFRFYVVPRFGARRRLPALLIGSGTVAREVFDEVNGNNRYGLTFIEEIDAKELPAGELDHLIRAALEHGVKTIVADTRDAKVAEGLAGTTDALLAGVVFVDLISFYEDIFDRAPLAGINYAWVVDSLPQGRTLYDLGKRAFDFALAVPLFILSLIIILPVALLLALTGGQPFIYHERIGKGGECFRIVKLRTMLMNDHGDPDLQKRNHVTRIGRILRKTRIDELPQLMNILAGDLSFIGPRPELPAIAAVYEREIPYYHIRHLITPGLSGWAQIREYDAPRGAADVERTKKKLSYDLYYVRRRSFGLDLGIALKTLRALLAFSGA